MHGRGLRLAIVLAVTTAVAVAGLSSRPAAASPALHVDGNHLRDAAGAVVVLRGVNVAGNAKVPPFRPVSSGAFFDPVQAWGMNVVRLLFSWEAYEPSRGSYDESYLDYYVSAVDAAASRGLYVVVDFHQDAFSRFTLGGCGDGFPSWAIPWWVFRSTPDNGAGCWDWGARMVFDIGMHVAWASFHGDAIGARTRYLAMLKRVAQRLVGRDAVIGYDVMNEPWGDEPTDIYRLHHDATAQLRSADPSAIIFVSPHALISAGGRSNLRRPTFANFVYAPHYYDASVILFKAWLGGGVDSSFANMRSVADAWGVPLFVGEFGGAATTTDLHAYLTANYDALDAALASGTQWVYTPGWTAARLDGWNSEDLSIIDDRGAPRAGFVARPYPRRVSGTPTAFVAALTGTPAERTVELTWEHDPATGATEVYVPALALFGGAALAIEADGAALSCAVAAGDLVRCTSEVPGLKQLRVTAR